MKHITLLVLAAILVCSCKTHSNIESKEYLTIRDTVRITESDTVWQTHAVISTRDSAYVEKEVVVEDEQGNVKRTDKTVVIRIKDSTSDSTDYYRSKFGALQKLYMAEMTKDNKEVRVVKEVDYRGWLCFAGLLMLIGLYSYIKVRKKWLH